MTEKGVGVKNANLQCLWETNFREEMAKTQTVRLQSREKKELHERRVTKMTEIKTACKIREHRSSYDTCGACGCQLPENARICYNCGACLTCP